MIVGARRPEEAAIFTGFAGYHQFHAEETQEEYGSFEVFFLADKGWYWWACFPGCVPDGEREGPYGSSRAALEAADEWHPEFDE